LEPSAFDGRNSSEIVGTDLSKPRAFSHERGRLAKDCLTVASEFDLIAALTAQLKPTDAVVGPGDDAAVLALGSGLHVMTSDLLVEGVDFRRTYASPRDVGFKAAAITLSDVAAMGARPRYMTVDVGSSEGTLELFSELGAGLQEACGPFDCSVVGGDVSRSPVLLLATTAIGRLKTRPVLRRGALPGDLLLCTGTLGDSAAGLLVLGEGLGGHPGLSIRHLRPQPRVEAGIRLGEQGLATAMIDVSDGLLQDLGHLCRQSGVSAIVWPEELPISADLVRFCREQTRDPVSFACAGGEDFELLFTAAEASLFSVQAALAGIVPVHVIGEIQQPRPGDSAAVRIVSGGRDVTDRDGWRSRSLGWDHFRDEPRVL
jgi:thiamine-monophosphate kinase